MLLHALRQEGGVTADTLRYLAVTGLLAGYSAEATTLLGRALHEALAERDLVGAVDALRRLDALGGSTAPLWTKTLRSVLKRGFEMVDASPSELEPYEEPPEDEDVEDVFMECLEIVVTTTPSVSQEPLHFVPLLSDFSDGDIRAAAKSLNIRLVAEGEHLGSVCEGSPAWVVSGTVHHGDAEIALPSGSLVLPDEESAIAASPTRLLVIDNEVWGSLKDDTRITRVLGDYRRSRRLTAALRASTFFRALPSDVRTEFLSQLNCTTIVDEPIIIRGYSVRGLFVMLHGQAAVALEDGSTRHEVARLQPGDVFGELDVLTAGGAEYDVLAEGEVEICFIDTDVARELLQRAPEARSRLVELRESRQRESLGMQGEASGDSDEATV